MASIDGQIAAVQLEVPRLSLRTGKRERWLGVQGPGVSFIVEFDAPVLNNAEAAAAGVVHFSGLIQLPSEQYPPGRPVRRLFQELYRPALSLSGAWVWRDEAGNDRPSLDLATIIVKAFVNRCFEAQ